MAKQDLTQERLKKLLHYDPETGVFTWIFRDTRIDLLGKVAGHVNRSSGYVDMRVGGVFVGGHVLAWFYINGAWPKNEIDHIDRCRSNNAIANLRLATRRENSQNINPSRLSKSGCRGVYLSPRGKWYAQGFDGVRVRTLGHFATIDEAVDARESFLESQGLLQFSATKR